MENSELLQGTGQTAAGIGAGTGQGVTLISSCYTSELMENVSWLHSDGIEAVRIPLLPAGPWQGG